LASSEAGSVNPGGTGDDTPAGEATHRLRDGGVRYCLLNGSAGAFPVPATGMREAFVGQAAQSMGFRCNIYIAVKHVSAGVNM